VRSDHCDATQRNVPHSLAFLVPGLPWAWNSRMARGIARAILLIGGGYGSTTTVQV